MVYSERSAKEDDNEFSFQTAAEDGLEFEQDPLTSLSLSHSQDSAAVAHHPRAPTNGRAWYVKVSKPNPAYEEWLCKDQLLVSWINSTLTQEIIAQVIDLTHAHQIWNALHENFAQQCQAREMQLRLASLLLQGFLCPCFHLKNIL